MQSSHLKGMVVRRHWPCQLFRTECRENRKQPIADWMNNAKDCPLSVVLCPLFLLHRPSPVACRSGQLTTDQGQRTSFAFTIHNSSFIIHPSPFILHPSYFILHTSFKRRSAPAERD